MEKFRFLLGASLMGMLFQSAYSMDSSKPVDENDSKKPVVLVIQGDGKAGDQQDKKYVMIMPAKNVEILRKAIRILNKITNKGERQDVSINQAAALLDLENQSKNDSEADVATMQDLSDEDEKIDTVRQDSVALSCTKKILAAGVSVGLVLGYLTMLVDDFKKGCRDNCAMYCMVTNTQVKILKFLGILK